MCRRYFIEVTGLDAENGEEQLQQAGVARDSILVVDDNNPVDAAIKEVTGYTMADLKVHSRNRSLVAARTMYVHYSIIGGESIAKVANVLRRTRMRIYYYKEEYDKRMFGDREFRIMSEKVGKMLENSPNWEIKSSKPVLLLKTRKRKKRKRMKRTRTTIIKPKTKKPTNSGQQLEIQF